MKVLVFSDVHGAKKRVKAVLDAHRDAKHKISLGDSELKESFLNEHDIIAIKGNYPFDRGVGLELSLKIKQRNIYLTHGHKTKVKYNYQTLYYKMLEAKADLALHGHTHVLHQEYIDGKYILNPGAINFPRGQEDVSYLILDFKENHIQATWLDANTHQPIKQSTLDI